MDPHTLDRPLRVLRACLHLLVAGLLVLVVVRAYVDALPHPPAVLATAAVMGAVYAVGPLMPWLVRSPRAGAGWLAVLCVVWLVLLWLTPDGVWLAFALFFLQLHLLPKRWGLVVVAVTTMLAIAGFIWHQGGFAVAVVIGPALGAAVAVATVLGYQALYRQSEQRQKLIEELRETRSGLAAAEHSAGVLAERERLAREIHDTLAQGLSSIQLLLRAAERALPDRPDTATPHVTQAREAAQDNLIEARRLVYALAPMELEGGESLPAALQRLCATMQQRCGLTVHFHLSGEPFDVPTPYEVALLRIAQSALANTVQHARASHAELTLTYMDTKVALDAVDDGVGFDPMEASRPAGQEGGFGLAAMRARARSLGGRWTVESSPGQGTALAASFPHEPGDDVSPGTASIAAGRR